MDNRFQMEKLRFDFKLSSCGECGRRVLSFHCASLRSIFFALGMAHTHSPSAMNHSLLDSAMGPVPTSSMSVQNDIALQHPNPVADAVHHDILNLNRGGFSDFHQPSSFRRSTVSRTC